MILGMHTTALQALALDGAATAKLTAAGPRAGADTGDPQTAGATIYASEDGRIAVGIWECTPGGWAISDRPDTEICTILAGRGTIADADGTVHELSVGTVITLPRGWSGRWDIAETLRKAYVVVTPGAD